MKYQFNFNKSTRIGKVLYPEIKRVVGYALKLKGKTTTSLLVKVVRTDYGFRVTTKDGQKILALVSI